MELTQLKYFQAVAVTEHYTKAAASLHISQSALSKAILRLEDELGVQLFSRGGNRVSLNAYGEILLRHVERALAELDCACQEIGEARANADRQLTIHMSDSWNLNMAVMGFITAFPDCHVAQQYHTVKQLREMLARGETELALSTMPIHGEQIVWQPLFQDRLGIIVSRDHPLAGQGRARLAEFADSTFIFNNTCSNAGHIQLSYCRQAGFEPRICYEGNEAALIAELVSIGHAVTFISRERYLATNGRMSGAAPTAFLEITEPYCANEVGVARRTDATLGGPTRLFFDFLTDWFQTHAPADAVISDNDSRE